MISCHECHCASHNSCIGYIPSYSGSLDNCLTLCCIDYDKVHALQALLRMWQRDEHEVYYVMGRAHVRMSVNATYCTDVYSDLRFVCQCPMGIGCGN